MLMGAMTSKLNLGEVTLGYNLDLWVSLIVPVEVAAGQSSRSF